MMKYLLLVNCMILLQLSLIAQIDYDKVQEPSAVLLMNNVFIHSNGNKDTTTHDILIKNGLIEKIDNQIDAPFNAVVIEVDSSYAYPSFIDLLSHTGIAKEERKETRDKIKYPGFPPNDLAGITPERLVDEKLDLSNSSIKSMRESGFGISHVVPRGRMLPGQGSLISLSGKKDCIIDNHVSMFMQLSGSRGMYPATVIGVMAKWRDLYRQASNLKEHSQRFNEGSNGFPRPQKDKSLEALFDVVSHNQKVFTKAEKVKDVYRILELQKELDYNLVLSNVKQGWQAINKIKDQNVSVALSMSLPKSEKKSKKGDKSKSKDDKPGKKDLEKEKKQKEKDNEDPLVKALTERKKKSLKEYERQAFEFEQAGIKFGFSMLDAKAGDVKKNLKRMIAAGMSEETAFNALTVYPAEILGITHISGSISEGKLANIFLTDKPYFEDESRIRYIILEGNHEELKVKEKEKTKVEDGEYDHLLGTWSYVVDIPEDRRTGEIVLKQVDESLEIKLIDNQDPDEHEPGTDVEISENKLAFTITVDDDGELPVRISLEFEGEDYEGTVTVEGIGSFPIDGKKIAKPE